MEPPAAARHIVEQQLALLRPLGVTADQATFWLPRDRAADAGLERALGASGLKAGDPVVVLNPGAGREAKRWPPVRASPSWPAACARTPAPPSSSCGDRRSSIRPEPSPGESGALLAPPTDLPALLALLRRTRVMVAADTGPLHLAAALGVACVGLYGPTDPARTGPYGAGHRVVRGGDGAMASVSVEPVLAAVAELLD